MCISSRSGAASRGPSATTYLSVPRLISAAFLWCALLLPARADAGSAMDAAQHILNSARQTAATDCTQTSEALVRILCSKQLRVGLRTFYPGYSVRDNNGAFSGYEVDIAQRIADFLGVRMVPVAVDPKTMVSLSMN